MRGEKFVYIILSSSHTYSPIIGRTACFTPSTSEQNFRHEDFNVSDVKHSITNETVETSAKFFFIFLIKTGVIYKV